jgi:competence protein ComFC
MPVVIEVSFSQRLLSKTERNDILEGENVVPVRVNAVVNSKLAKLASTGAELLFPGRCLLCGGSLLTPPAPKSVRPFYPVCGVCLDSLQPLQGRRCSICSAPLISEHSVCTRCRRRDYQFTANVSLFAYRDSAKELIYQYKFKQRRRVALVLADLLATAYREIFAGLSLVPVPGRRAGDHIEIICRRLERKHDVPVCRLLARRGGVPQKSLDYVQRSRNIRGSITYIGTTPAPATTVVLLDDVFTSGATANECARVLLARGMEVVQVLTFALG